MRVALPFIWLALAAFLQSAETPIPATLASRVTDTATFMSPSAVQALESRLAAYEKSTGRQIFVYIGKTTGGAPIDDWAVRAFKQWKVGRKGFDDGVLLVIMSDDRKLRIEVGYGLEPTLTDVKSSHIINEVMVPKIRANDRDGAVAAGVDAIISVIEGKPLPEAQTSTSRSTAVRTQPMPLWQSVLFGILGIALLIFIITHPSLAMYLLINILSNSGRGGYGSSGGFGGGGGGFSGGGGGRSGGGGASGSW